MKTVTNKRGFKVDRAAATRAAGRIGLLVFLALVLILTGGGFWYWRQSQQASAAVGTSPTPGKRLSETTIRILAGLTSPIELRLFAPAEVSVLPPALAGYVTRVASLLTEYERVADGKIRVIKRDPQSDAAAKVAAGAAGVVPFATENGEFVYLGLTVANGARVEAIAPLAPEWEAALESDVSRAISRVVATTAAPARPGSPLPAAPAPIDPAISEELLKAFPDLASRTFEDAAQALRAVTLEEFKAAATAMQAKVQVAQKALATARQSQSEAAQQAALKEFQRVQLEQTDKLKEITARLQDRIEVLKRLKGASPPPAAAH